MAKLFLILILFIPLVCLSLEGVKIKKNDKKSLLTIVIPKKINLSLNEIKKYFQSIEINKTVELKIYYFSSGVETVTMNDNKFIMGRKKSIIKALLKIRKNKKLYKVHFISSIGNSRLIVFKKLAAKVHEITKKYM